LTPNTKLIGRHRILSKIKNPNPTFDPTFDNNTDTNFAMFTDPDLDLDTIFGFSNITLILTL
jgi:hypothetical protein